MVTLSAFADEAGSSLQEQICALKENGLSYIDVRGIDGLNVSKFTDTQAAEYYRALRAEGIAVSCIGSPLGKREVCDFAELRVELDRILRIAEIMETTKVRIFSFYHFEGREAEILDCLSQAVAYAAERGVTLYHENELGILGDAPEACLRILEATGCGCIFDPANFVLAGHDIARAERLLLPRSDFYHVKDGRYTKEIVPAGYGDGNLRQLLSHDNVTLTVEPHLATFDGLSSLTSHGLRPSEFVFDTMRAAFDAGVFAVKAILDENGIAYR